MESVGYHFSFGRGGLLPQEELLDISTRNPDLVIGIPKEIDTNESRVAITPQAAKLLVEGGLRIIMERGAGEGAHFSDRSYSEAGVEIRDSKKEVYEAKILIKVAPFDMEEVKLVKDRQTIISSFILRNNVSEVIKALMKKKVTAIAFEFMRDLEGCYPVVRSLSEIAGNVALHIASEAMSNAGGGKGVLLGGITGVSPSEVVILGANTASEFIARTALAMGAHVKVFDSILQRLINIQNSVGQRIFTSNYHPQVLLKALQSAEVVIGAIQPMGEGNAFYVSEEMIKEMKPGSVIIDLGVDQGGCFETSRCTTHKKPTFRKHGVIHYCVPNITSRVAKTSSIALSNIFAPIVHRIGEFGGITPYVKTDFTTRQGVYLYNGILTNHFIGKKMNIPHKNIDLLMAAF